MSEKDRERLIDDFVFIMILLGNDFLPELPSLDIVNGSIQDLIAIYKYSSFSPNRCSLAEKSAWIATNSSSTTPSPPFPCFASSSRSSARPRRS